MVHPLLSIVTCARNDNYMGNANWRLETTVNFLAAELDKLNRLHDVEFIIVDWGSNVPLATIVPLTEQAKRIARFIYVPTSVIDQINARSKFPAVIAANAGIRRAGGYLIMFSPADILFTVNFLRNIFFMIDGDKDNVGLSLRKLFCFSRKDIPIEIVNRNLPLGELSKYLEEHGSGLETTPLHPYYLSPAGALMMHRDLWCESHAFDERLVDWGWSDNDLCLRMRLRYSVADMSGDKDMSLYHLNHYTHGFVRARINTFLINPFVVNGDDWGLARYQLEEDVTSTISDDCLSKIQRVSKTEVYFREKHIMKLIAFFMRNISFHNLIIFYYHLTLVISSYRENSVIKKLYNVAWKLKSMIKRDHNIR